MEYFPKKVALCTAVYPGVEPYLQDWYASVLRQTDQDFRIWIALDGLDIKQAVQAFGSVPKDVVWVQAESGDTPATVRQRVLAEIVSSCDGIVLVDSDDMLYPGRVAAARKGLSGYELVGCALRLVDQGGNVLGHYLRPPAHFTPDLILPRYNMFGLSNTAWRSGVLRGCLPIPPDIEIVDWFLATRAWLRGAAIFFDSAAGMDYRQHPSNMTRVQAPFSREQVIGDTKRVLYHFRRILETPLEGAIETRRKKIMKVVEDVEQFERFVIQDKKKLGRYVEDLNAMDLPLLWWYSVAHPSLKQAWSDKKEKK